VREIKALEIKKRILAIASKADFEALRNDRDYTREELNWVRVHLLTPEQPQAFQEAATAVPSD
jgi:hypothetical protein